MLLESSFYSTCVTHDNRYLQASYFYNTGHRCQDIAKLTISLNNPSVTRSTIINRLEQIYNRSVKARNPYCMGRLSTLDLLVLASLVLLLMI